MTYYNRKKFFKQLLKNEYDYTDRSQYISKHMAKKKKKTAGNKFTRMTPDAFNNDAWNSPLGRKLKKDNKIK